jgi:hypothetical protein
MKNYKKVLGMSVMLLTFVLGCATFKMDEGSISQEIITLEIGDLKAYAAEKGLYGGIEASSSTSFIGQVLANASSDTTDAIRRSFANDPEAYIVMPQLKAITDEKGYTKQNSWTGAAWIDLNKAMPGAEIPVYPKAMVYTFTETGKKGQRQSIQVRTRVPIEMQSYQVRQLRPATQAASATSDMVGIFATQAEADQYAVEYKKKNPELADRITAVGSFTAPEGTVSVNDPALTSRPNYVPQGTMYYAAFKE